MGIPIVTDILYRTVSELSQLIVQILDTLRFWANLWGLETTYNVYLGLIGKRVVDFLLNFLRLFVLELRQTVDRTAERQAFQHNALCELALCSASYDSNMLHTFMSFVAQIVRSGKMECGAFHEGCRNDGKAKHSGLTAYFHDDLYDYQPTRVLRFSTAQLYCFSCLRRRCTYIYCAELTLAH